MSEVIKTLIMTYPGPVAVFLSAFGIGFLIILIALIKGRGELKVKNVTLAFGGTKKADPRMNSIGDYMDVLLRDIRSDFYSGYLRLMKVGGCPEEILNECEDSRYVDQMLGNMVWSGNGIRSVKTCIEKVVLEKLFISMTPAEVRGLVMQTIEQNSKKYINDNYETFVKRPDKTERARLVSNTDWVDSLPESLRKIEPKVERLMEYSRALYKKV